MPFRGLLLGLFFITVGFTIDTALLVAEPLRVAGLVGGLLAFKALVITVLCRFGFGITFSQGLQAGLLLAQVAPLWLGGRGGRSPRLWFYEHGTRVVLRYRELKQRRVPKENTK